MNIPGGLNADEQAAWAKLAESVTPLSGRARPTPVKPVNEPQTAPLNQSGKPVMPTPRPPASGAAGRPASPPAPSSPPSSLARSPAQRRAFASQLDSNWNRRLKAGQIAPDYTLDLHGHTLDSAYSRAISGLDQAQAMGARVVLVIAGRERPVDPADRGHRRGAIRAKLLDWLAASHHADSIAAIRRAHIRHGGEGALYLVLKRTGQPRS